MLTSYIVSNRQLPRRITMKHSINLLRSLFRLLFQDLRRLILSIKGGVIHPNTVVRTCCFNGPLYNLKVDKLTVLEGVELHLHAQVNIGRNTVINNGFKIFTASHFTDDATWATKIGNVNIGDYCWIASSAIILPGVNIGNYAIVGAGAVVTKDVEPFSVMGGNPARKIKERKKNEYTYSPVSFVSMCHIWRTF